MSRSYAQLSTGHLRSPSVMTFPKSPTSSTFKDGGRVVHEKNQSSPLSPSYPYYPSKVRPLPPITPTEKVKHAYSNRPLPNPPIPCNASHSNSSFSSNSSSFGSVTTTSGTDQPTRPNNLTPIRIPPLSSSSSASSSSEEIPPEEPFIPPCRSPFTQTRKRFSKLRRHFGEPPPFDLVFSALPVTTATSNKDGEGDEFTQTLTLNQFSSKWVREEKSGRRKTEEDFGVVAQHLRKL